MKNTFESFPKLKNFLLIPVVLTFFALFFLAKTGTETISAQENAIEEIGDLPQTARQDMLSIALDFRSAANRSVFAGNGIFSDENSKIKGNAADELQDKDTGKEARADLEKSFSAINQLPCRRLDSETLRNGKFSPGVYCVSAADLSEEMIFDAEENENGFFVFLIKNSFAANGGLKTSLAGKARSENIFYIVGDTAKVSANTDFTGNIFARNSVEAEKGSKIRGKIFSLDGSVKLNQTEVSPSGVGYITICKRQVGTGLEERIFRFRVADNIILVQTGRCSVPIELAQGNYVIEELLDGYLTTGGSFSGRFRLVDVNSTTSGAVTLTNLLLRKANIFVREGSFEQPTTFNFVNTFSQIGTVEICNQTVAPTTNPPINDQDVTGFFDYTIDAIPNQIFTVPVGQCSGPIQVNVPTAPPPPLPPDARVRITQIARQGYTLNSVTTFPAASLIEVKFNKGITNDGSMTEFENPRGGYASAVILEGGVSVQTKYTFFNRTNPARIKICKIAGSGIPVGTRFNFTVTGLVNNGTTAPISVSATPTTETVTVQAGSPAQGGFCAFTTNRYIVGSNVSVVEQLPALEPIPNVPPGEVRVSEIRVSAPSTVAASNLNTRTVIFSVRGEVVEVTYTNIVFRPTLLKICAIAGPGIAVGTPFTFDVVILDSPNLSVPRVTVPAGPASQGGFCRFAEGPYTPTNTTPPVGTFPVGVRVQVTQTAIAGTSTTISSTTGTPDLCTFVSPRCATLTLGFPIGFNEITFTGSACTLADSGNLTPSCFPDPFYNLFDFDGDRRADVSIFSQQGKWSWIRSSNGVLEQFNFGSGTDLPVTADYDGDGKNDVGVYRNGVWYILRSSDGVLRAEGFGASGDVPQFGDFDGDGRADLAVFRPSNGTWYVMRSRDGFFAMPFGFSTDKPVSGDFDGDGRADIAVYRSSEGILMQSTGGFRADHFGITSDIPVPADYDGDGRADIAVYRGGTWYISLSSSISPQNYSTVHLGTANDTPLPSILVK